MTQQQYRWQRKAGSALLLLVAGATSGCLSEKSEPDEKGTAFRATGRIEASAAPPLTIAITAPDGEAVLSIPAHATRRSDGSILVADWGAHTLVQFDSMGTRIRGVGREGDGPGEFRSVRRVHHCGGDSLLTLDQQQQRLTLFDTSLALVRTIAVPGAFEMECSEGWIATVTDLIGLGFASADGPPITARLRMLDPVGDSIGGVASIIMGENRPMAAITTLAMTNERLYVGTGSRAEVKVYDLTGRPLDPILLGWKPRASTPRHYDAAIQKLLRTVNDQASKDFYLQTIEGIPRPEWLPFYTKILTDPAGNLWLVTSAVGDGHTTLAALRPDGREIGTLTLPVELDVWEMGSDYVLGGVETETGGWDVVMFRFRIRPAP